jgi:hypothetical protein
VEQRRTTTADRQPSVAEVSDEDDDHPPPALDQKAAEPGIDPNILLQESQQNTARIPDIKLEAAEPINYSDNV